MKKNLSKWLLVLEILSIACLHAVKINHKATMENRDRIARMQAVRGHQSNSFPLRFFSRIK